MRIVEDPFLFVDGEPYEVPRSWKERLFSRPWNPFKKTNTVVPRVPSKDVYMLNSNTMVMHPETAKIYRAHLDTYVRNLDPNQFIDKRSYL